MPPRIPIQLPHRSISCPNAISTPRRHFSHTRTALALGPQSPNYIDIPKSKQPGYEKKPEIKGHLPVPRDIFKTRNPNPKVSQKFLKSSAPPPKNRKVPGPYSRDAELILYKQRLADKRRAALNEGVKELHARKAATDTAFRTKVDADRTNRIQLATAPPRETDVLTRTSMSKGVRDFLMDKLPTLSRASTAPARCAAYQRRLTRIRERRNAQLHDLYTNARAFIVNEEQLDNAIEVAFGSEENPVGWDVRGNMGLVGAEQGAMSKDGLSPWHGPIPEGTAEKLKKLRGGEGIGLAQERMRKVAEALTGGKM